ncbi:hypothetical protein [Mucilaginibacter gossypii]|uniref:Uncharacterized protein n=1 Tax=Mucilaginibacter gossypii TaxID=551996 RepID=A0A1G8B7C0_9SPHI|nr:hypothetical protein [Mucilaginibacter gossypii]SDH29024.1 hypothetical protein SAMN05192573_108114 [Mucilaginibacter gossypii]
MKHFVVSISVVLFYATLISMFKPCYPEGTIGSSASTSGIGSSDKSLSPKTIVSKWVDDAILKQKAVSEISPTPHFSSYEFHYQEKVFGVIEIPVFPYDMPLIAILSMKGILPDIL